MCVYRLQNNAENSVNRTYSNMLVILVISVVTDTVVIITLVINSGY